jgi:hypothetical protein
MAEWHTSQNIAKPHDLAPSLMKTPRLMATTGASDWVTVKGHQSHCIHNDDVFGAFQQHLFRFVSELLHGHDWFGTDGDWPAVWCHPAGGAQGFEDSAMFSIEIKA